jgi:hypothetical protein
MYKPILLCLVAAACAAPIANEKPGPRGLRADQHLGAASRDDERGEELARWPDLRPGADGSTAGPRLAAGTWYGTWDTAAEHRRRAQVHRSAAAQIQAEYDEACRDLPAAVAAVSPLQRHALGGSPTADGMLMVLSVEAGAPDRLLAAMRCHRAWMMLGRNDMDDCPLDLPGLQVSARGDETGIELTMTVVDPALVPELQRRAALDLEAARHRRAAVR